MSVVIRGMKMPKDCTECRFAFDGRCFANWGRKSKIDVTNYCPLVELPAQHGRLIDADALHYSRIRIVHNDCTIGGYNAVVMSAEIKDAPTIIEAEESE